MSPMPAARLPAPSHPSPAGRPSPAQRWRALLLALLLPVLAALLLGRALPARAAGTVGSGTPGSCTYSALVAAAAGGGLVQFNCGFLPKTIVVTQTGGLLAPNNLTLDGGGRIILSGADSNRLLTVLAGRAVTLTHIVLAHGFQPGGAGGAVLNQGRLTLNNVIIRDSVAGNSVYFGGAIDNESPARLVVRQSQFLRNSSSQGGAIFNAHGGAVDIDGSQFISNSILGLDGGAIFNNGVLTLTASAFSDNIVSRTVTATGDPHGGGALANSDLGQALVVSTVFTANQVAGAFLGDTGGAVLNLGVLTLTGGAFVQNTAFEGGALRLDGASTILSPTASANHAFYGGFAEVEGSGSVLVQGLVAVGNQGDSGGVVRSINSTLRIFNSLFQDNDATSIGGAIELQRDLVISNSTFAGNHAGLEAGAIDKGGGILRVYGSTFMGNSSAGKGGAIYNFKNPLVLENVTFSGNLAATDGGGVWSGATALLRNVTLNGNTAAHGGALFNLSSILALTNTIAAGSPSGGNCGGAGVTSSAYSLSSDNLCGLSGPGDHNLTDPQLSALGDYGGPTLTFMPAANSPAIDGVVGSNAPPTDQRGQNRPFGPGIDIGAIERQLNDSSLLPRLYLPLVRR